jgi:predicted thioesterase
MIAFMEINTRKLLDELLPEGYTTVGVHVDVSHLAPASFGSKVTAHGEIQSINEDRITLAVEVRQGDTVIGTGTHRRHVIDIQRFINRVEADQSA